MKRWRHSETLIIALCIKAVVKGASFKTNVLWSKNNIVIRFLGYVYQATVARIETFQYHMYKVTISSNHSDIWMAVTFSIFIVSWWNKNGMYGIQVTKLLCYDIQVLLSLLVLSLRSSNSAFGSLMGFSKIRPSLKLDCRIVIYAAHSVKSLGVTARWLQLQPSSAWPRPTVSAFQYFRWCALTKPAVSHFLRQIYSLSKEEGL